MNKYTLQNLAMNLIGLPSPYLEYTGGYPKEYPFLNNDYMNQNLYPISGYVYNTPLYNLFYNAGIDINRERYNYNNRRSFK